MRKVPIVAAPVLALLLALLVLSPVAAQTSPLDGTSWVLSSLGGDLPLPGSTVTLSFEEGNAVGTDGCNRYVLGYSVDGATIAFGEAAGGDVGPGISTMMACPEAASAQAAAYMEALASANRFLTRGGNLVLLQGVDVVATFVSVLQDVNQTNWLVTAYNNGREAVVGVLDGADITVRFEDDDTFTGNAGCNEFFGAYVVTGDDTVLVGRIGSTRKLCTTPAGVMEQEAAFLAALQSAASFSIEGNDLTLRDASDAIAVMMTRVFDVESPEPAPGVPTGRVSAGSGVNLRAGPGTNFPVVGGARFADEFEVTGRNGNWWQVVAPGVTGGVAWVSGDFLAVTDAADVPLVAAPPPPVVIAPTPAPTPIPPPTPIPQPTATPAPVISLTADSTTITQGQCTTIRWNVENVQAVWVYPQGQNYRNFPRTGQGAEQVCPAGTVTYEMRVLLRDGSVTTRQVTISVTPAPVTNPLDGTSWTVTGFNNGRGAVVSPISGTTLTARFEGSTISGQGGCNNFTGSYGVSGSSNIWISALGGGMMMCSDVEGQMEQEQQYLAALQSASTFRFDGNRLELRGWDGSIAVMFTRLQ